MKKPMKHNAPQKTLLPVKLSLTLHLTDDETCRLWAAYKNAHADLDPSNGQMAVALITRGLKTWKQEKGL